MNCYIVPIADLLVYRSIKSDLSDAGICYHPMILPHAGIEAPTNLLMVMCDPVTFNALFNTELICDDLCKVLEQYPPEFRSRIAARFCSGCGRLKTNIECTCYMAA